MARIVYGNDADEAFDWPPGRFYVQVAGPTAGRSLPMRVERELMRGAGPVAVLRLLADGEKYGYELVEALAKRSDGVLDMGQSTLYPMLYNLQAKRLIDARWHEADNGRKRKYYRLTDRGRKRLASETKQWQALAKAMLAIGVLQPSHATELALGGTTS